MNKQGITLSLTYEQRETGVHCRRAGTDENQQRHHATNISHRRCRLFERRHRYSL